MCIAVFLSGNHAYHMRDYFQMLGMSFEIVSVPAKISEGYCGTALKVPRARIRELVKAANEQHCPVKALFIKDDMGNYFPIALPRA